MSHSYAKLVTMCINYMWMTPLVHIFIHLCLVVPLHPSTSLVCSYNCFVLVPPLLSTYTHYWCVSMPIDLMCLMPLVGDYFPHMSFTCSQRYLIHICDMHMWHISISRKHYWNPFGMEGTLVSWFGWHGSWKKKMEYFFIFNSIPIDEKKKFNMKSRYLAYEK